MPSKKENYTQKEKESKCLIAGVTSKTKTSRIRRGMVAGPVAQVITLETCRWYISDIFPP